MTADLDVHPIIRRLWIRTVVDQTTGCWIWKGRPNSTGYGQISIKGELVTVHRIAKRILHGFDESLTLDHLCRNRACWNPDHLDPCTLEENIRRGTSPSALHAVQTHCVHGHEFTDSNTMLYRKRNGRTMRICRACRIARRQAA